MSYLGKVKKSLEFIESNLKEELRLLNVARVVAFSPYHFHYVFGATVGESFKDYIRKRRLTEAAHELRKSERRIIEIALDYQFESQCDYGYCYATPEMAQAEQMRYIAGVKVKSLRNIPQGMVGVRIPAQNYAVFTHRGPVAKIGVSYDYIYKAWFPKSGKEPAQGPDFELYDERFKYDAEDSELDLYVPVK